MISKALFSSKSDEWETPQDFFDKLNEEFNFDLDPCASDQNHKCARYFTKEDDGLRQDWGGCRVFCNPPYGRLMIRWARKCYEESRKPGTVVVMLAHARTDTRWFHEFCYGKAELRFIKGRLHFGGADRAPFPSMVAIYKGDEEGGGA